MKRNSGSIEQFDPELTAEGLTVEVPQQKNFLHGFFYFFEIFTRAGRIILS